MAGVPGTSSGLTSGVPRSVFLSVQTQPFYGAPPVPDVSETFGPLQIGEGLAVQIEHPPVNVMGGAYTAEPGEKGTITIPLLERMGVGPCLHKRGAFMKAFIGPPNIFSLNPTLSVDNTPQYPFTNPAWTPPNENVLPGAANPNAIFALLGDITAVENPTYTPTTKDLPDGTVRQMSLRVTGTFRINRNVENPGAVMGDGLIIRAGGGNVNAPTELSPCKFYTLAFQREDGSFLYIENARIFRHTGQDFGLTGEQEGIYRYEAYSARVFPIFQTTDTGLFNILRALTHENVNLPRRLHAQVTTDREGDMLLDEGGVYTAQASYPMITPMVSASFGGFDGVTFGITVTSVLPAIYGNSTIPAIIM